MRSFTFLSALIFLSACSTKKIADIPAYKLNQTLSKIAPYDEGFPLTDEQVDEEAPFKADDYIKYYADYYKDKVAPPKFDFNADLSEKSFNELRFLRAEVLARHGYLFMDYVMRSQFGATNWYKPVFWYPDFKIKLTPEEKNFIERVLKREQELYSKNYILTGGSKTANMDNVVNWQQFETLHPEMKEHLSKDGFVINKADYGQLFHVYDENYYDYTPSFLTTDLYLQVLHMHISKEMQSIENEKLISLLTLLMRELNEHAVNLEKSLRNPLGIKACEWNQVYYSVALSLATGEKLEVPQNLESYYKYELEHATAGQGFKSEFLGDSLMDYTQFQPRGNYTTSDSLKRYFKMVKWLNSASIYLDEENRLASAILMADGLLKSETSLKKYNAFSEIVGFLAGKEDNLSFQHLTRILKEYNYSNVEEMLTREKLTDIRKKLYALDPQKIMAKGANAITNNFLARKKLLFTAGRYTFDGEILQRLVDIARPSLNIEPKRPFPKGLDVFAAMGNRAAEDILLNVYKENEKWPAYSDSLNMLKNKFRAFDEWNQSIYSKTMEALLSIHFKNIPSDPYYMQLPKWQKKDLNTMLGGWTGLKHDMILYIKQPSGAEMGDGGDIPPPQKIAYVEPKIAFWTKCIELLTLNRKILEENNLMTGNIKSVNEDLINMAFLFQRISTKEVTGVFLTNAEFDSLSYIGGRIESLTLDIIDSGESGISYVETPEKYIAIATDVYTYNENCLEETVGMADEIYVIAEINGLLYLSRGAVFSQYEFVQPTSNRLTDEEWQKQLLDHREPAFPVWMNDIKIKVPHLKTSPNYNLY